MVCFNSQRPQEAELALHEWMPVPGYPDIEVSDDLRSRTLERSVAYVRPSGVVSSRNIPSKNLNVNWCNRDDCATVFISRLRRPIGARVLVCLAWYGLPPEKKPWALHRDGDSANFTPENVYWGDEFANTQDAIRPGVLPRGAAQGNPNSAVYKSHRSARHLKHMRVLTALLGLGD
jgi:hypothetical protein